MSVYNTTILVVEDDLGDQELIERGFRDNGINKPIKIVSNGIEAIAYLNGDGQFSDRDKFPYPSFIMTDLKMPGGDGFSVLQHLKANPEWAIIPTVVFSSSSDEDDIKKSYMLGASSYHQKPLGYVELRAQLRILHDYWMTCKVPKVDITGKRLTTSCQGKLSERYTPPY